MDLEVHYFLPQRHASYFDSLPYYLLSHSTTLISRSGTLFHLRRKSGISIWHRGTTRSSQIIDAVFAIQFLLGIVYSFLQTGFRISLDMDMMDREWTCLIV